MPASSVTELRLCEENLQYDDASPCRFSIFVAGRFRTGSRHAIFKPATGGGWVRHRVFRTGTRHAGFEPAVGGGG